MQTVYLETMAEDIPYDSIPANWNSFDIKLFSRKKNLYDYQEQSVVNAIKILWKYYEDFVDYNPGENREVHQTRKEKLFEWYRNNGCNEDLDIRLNSSNRAIVELLGSYYDFEGNKLPYVNFINRMSFWMATGSGKTLVLVKIIEILRGLIQYGEIPANDILVLTHREDLIDQLKNHIEEFNASHSDIFIHVRELKEYESVKRINPSLFRDREMTIFYYRSDNLSDEQKERIIDFRNYDNNGQWYVFLDEAHKGDREDSKRQHIYSILSRNGFLFNFSATFTDIRDVISTVANFNLREFIRNGYGKHITLLKQEIREFRHEEDFTDEEKQKVVLKSLIMISYVRRFYEAIKHHQSNKIIYHKPLLLTLVNSVNTADADLKLFFRELERIGRGNISHNLIDTAKNELYDELRANPELIFEEESNFELNEQFFNSIGIETLLQDIYNSDTHGETEIFVRPSNKHELAFKVKTSDKPYALIKIGDISGWLKEELAGYELNERFDDEGYFERLNDETSDINILMGSRSFYEGWDSNRPNVINFINIGTGTDAKKFILQSVGRGVRIEPVKYMRQRLVHLYNAGSVSETLYSRIRNYVFPVETLFIFGTNRQALQTVISHFESERKQGELQQLTLSINEEAHDKQLLIPSYKSSDHSLAEQKRTAKFQLTDYELKLLQRYVNYINDDRVFIAKYNTEPRKVEFIRNSIENVDDYYAINGKSYKNIDILVQRIFDYFDIIPEEFEKFKQIDDEINHFKNIRVTIEDITELKNKTESVRDYPKHVKELQQQYGKITPEEYTKQAESLKKEKEFTHNGKKVAIRNIANHYYLPLLISNESERIEYIKHIIQTPSEIKFINDLSKYLEGENKFNQFDWWMFSKLDESLDKVYIPYYNPHANEISKFKPDFIFWLKQDEEYYILFVDPKGTEHTDYQRKIDGYSYVYLTEDKSVKKLTYNGVDVKVFLKMYTSDISIVAEGYRSFWFDRVEKCLESIL